MFFNNSLWALKDRFAYPWRSYPSRVLKCRGSIYKEPGVKTKIAPNFQSREMCDVGIIVRKVIHEICHLSSYIGLIMYEGCFSFHFVSLFTKVSLKE